MRAPLRIGPHVAVTEAKGLRVKPGRLYRCPLAVWLNSPVRSQTVRMPSRQARRKAERDGTSPGAPELPAVGARVRCEGLTGAAELNGCLGRVLSHEGARAKVRMDGPGGRVVGVKPQNLVVVADAAKRAPAKGAGGAAAARADVPVNPGGDWTTQTEDPSTLVDALGAEVVMRRAALGDMESQWSVGFMLMDGAASSSRSADVGLTLRNFRLLTRPRCVDVVWSYT